MDVKRKDRPLSRAKAPLFCLRRGRPGGRPVPPFRRAFGWDLPLPSPARTILACLLLSLVLFAGCGEEPERQLNLSRDSGAQIEEEGQLWELKVAYLYTDYDDPENARRERLLREQLEAYKDTRLVSRYTTFCCNGDVSRQADQLERLADEGYDILFLNACQSTGLDDAIDAAVDQGSLVVNLGSVYPHSRIYNILPDLEQNLRLRVEFLADALDGQGRVLLFTPTSGIFQEADSIFAAILSEYPGLEVAASFRYDSLRTLSLQMEEFLEKGTAYDAILTVGGVNELLWEIFSAGTGYPQAIAADSAIGPIREQDRLESQHPFAYLAVEDFDGYYLSALEIALELLRGSTLREEYRTDGVVQLTLPGLWYLLPEEMDNYLIANTAMDNSDEAVYQLSRQELMSLFEPADSSQPQP